MENYLNVLRKYAEFDGRATRREYWMFVLINFLIGLGLAVLSLIGFGFISYLYSLAILVPSIAVMARRMHDVGKSGFWLLLSFIPLIGMIIVIIFLCQRGDEGPNIYGDDPRMEYAPQ